MPLLLKKIVKLAKKEAEKLGLSLEEHLVDLVVRGSLIAYSLSPSRIRLDR